MLSTLYSDRLLEAAADIPPRAVLEDADATARRTSKVCGSSVTVSLRLEDGVVADIGLDVQACALGQAASSLLAKHIRGATPDEVRHLQEEMFAMLKEEGPVPSGDRWSALATLQPIKDYPARHASTMLVFDAAVDCLDQIDAKLADG